MHGWRAQPTNSSMVIAVAGFFLWALLATCTVAWNRSTAETFFDLAPWALAATPFVMVLGVLLAFVWLGLPVRLCVGRERWSADGLLRVVGLAVFGPVTLQLLAFAALVVTGTLPIDRGIHLTADRVGEVVRAASQVWLVVALAMGVASLPGMDGRRALVAVFWPVVLGVVIALLLPG